MHVMRILGFALALTTALTLFACNKKETSPSDGPSGKPAATGSSAVTKDDDGCGGATCGKCLGTSGCWWNQAKKTCRLGLPEGVSPDKPKPWVNMPEDCK
jgi:hypothetical protein